MGKKRKRLAVLVGQADESFQSRFISGFTKQAFNLGQDVCVFSMFKKYQDTVEREMGESNIFSLINPDYFDGILILKDTIQTAGVAEDIEKRLNDTYSGPVLVVDLESKYYDTVFIDCFNPVVKLTNHLIEDHGIKDIAFLTGKKKHRHSIQRLAGYMEAMKNHDLKVPEDRILEGDFWYLSGEQCVDGLLVSGKPLPEAIICANDPMAIGACKAFEEKGIRVPEDIIVVGCDSNEEGQTSPKIVTSYVAPAFELGKYSVEALEDIRAGKLLREFNAEAEIIYGETCGCSKMRDFGYNIRRSEWTTEIYEEGFGSVNNMLFENLTTQSDILDFIGTVYSYAYQIKGAQSLHICLVSDTLDKGNNRFYKNEGYPEKMIHVLKYSRNHENDMVGIEEYFDTREMLPGLTDYRDEPTGYFFTPIFFEDKCYGYSVVSYGNNARSYDGLYRSWIKTMALGLDNLRKNMALAQLNEEINGLKSSKFDKYDAMYDNLSSEEKEDYDLVSDIVENNLFTYHFQPIVSAVDGEIYSYEALMRSKTRRKISPLAILKYASMQNQFPKIESETFNNVLDYIDKKQNEIGNAKIFINSIPGIRIDDMDEITRKLKLHHDRVVVELTEEAEMDDSDLERLKAYLASLDVEIAVDDYGTGYSNISNLLRYMPNYVKIDRSLLSEIQNKPPKQHFVREIIDFCHSNNIMALAEGVETSEELRMVIHLGADLIQGYYTGKPVPQFIGRIDEKIINEIKTYYQEKIDGRSKKIYIAGKTNRVSLINLHKENISDIVIGQDNMVYKDITIVGLPSLTTEMHLRIEPGYSGRITLENVYFSNIKNRPCIELGENSDVSLCLKGYNILRNTGIEVPASANLDIEGEGSLRIELTNQEFFGIGNDINSKHGSLNIHQSGNLTITANGINGCYIGSGLGGSIEIGNGTYNFEGNSTKLICIGSLSENSDIAIKKCGIEIDISGTNVIGIGSYDKNTSVTISDCSLKAIINGREVVGIGTITGDSTFVKIYNSFVEFSINADKCTALGSLIHDTKLDISMASARVNNVGEKALAFGGFEGDTNISLIGVDTRVKVFNTVGCETFAKDENITIVNGRCRIIVNDNDVERELIFKLDKK